MSSRERHELREAILLGLGCVIVGVWVIGVLVQVAFPSHVLPTEVHGIAFVVASALFGGAALAARKGDAA